jgi:hypothetical protein
MSSDETSDVLYITYQFINTSQTASTNQMCLITQQNNAVVDNIQNYNIYVESITTTCADVPIFCIYRNIAWNANNFLNNKTNYSISIQMNDGTHPFLIDPNNNLCVGLGSQVNGKYSGMTVFLQYQSANGTFPNPNPNGYINTGYNSSNYPKYYFDINNIDTFILMINTAINTIISCWTGAPIAQNSMYFYFNTTTNLINFIMPNAFYTANAGFYVNTFLQRALAGLRWESLNHDNVASPSYQGLDYKLIKQTYPNNYNSSLAQWTYNSTYQTVCNLADIHSLLLVSNYGDLTQIQPQYVPANSLNGSYSNQNLPNISCLKALDVSLDSFNNGIPYLQYEAIGLFFPLNVLGYGQLTNINLQLFVQNIDNTTYPLMINPGGYCNVRLALKRRNN